MKVFDAYPPEKPGKRPRCEAELGRYTAERNQKWVERNLPCMKGKEPHICYNFARYLINGKYYCRKHAGLILLDAMSTPQRSPAGDVPEDVSP